MDGSSILTDDGWFEIDEDRPWDVFPCSSLTEEGVEGVVSSSDRLITRHLTIWLDTVFQTIQLPTGVSHLDAGLTHVY